MFDQLNSLADIDRLIASGLRESETVEYKRAKEPLKPRDHEELAKDISAFANSSGGLLIYGVATSKTDRTLPLEREAILISNVDTVLQVISTHIRHPIPGLRHKTIPSSGVPELLLVEVPQSDLAPHQVAVRDYRYYRRQGPQTVPMPHDLVELYFARRSAPVLEPIVRSSDLANPPAGAWLVDLRMQLVNRGTRLAKLAMIQLDVPKSGPVELVRFHGIPTTLARTETDASTTWRLPMPASQVYYPGVPVDAVHLDVRVPNPTLGRERSLMLIELHAEDMRARCYELFLSTENPRFSAEAVVDFVGAPGDKHS